MLLQTVPTGNTAFFQWIKPLIDDKHITEVLIGIATVAVVVWTAGFVVRSIGHQPGRGLVLGMNFAQLAFMGALVAAFLTPLALQAVALIFLIQALWTVIGNYFMFRMPAEKRTYGQLQTLTLFGLEKGEGLAWYLLSEGTYIAAIVFILIWPSRIVALPLLWLALYGSYQILISFLYQPTDSQQAAISSPTTANPVVGTSLSILVNTQIEIKNAFDNSSIVATVFAARQQDFIETKLIQRSLQESALTMTQFQVLAQTFKPPSNILASGYLHALITHRAATAKLYELVLGSPYQPQSAMGLIDEIRPLLFYDVPGSTGSNILEFAVQQDAVNLVIRDTRLDTATRTISLAWLGEVYCEEANTALLLVLRRLFTPSSAAPANASQNKS